MPQKTRPSLADDGLVTPEIGPWSELKHDLFQAYARVFATSMKNKWERVYVDLFAGSGRARIRETSRIVLTSPFLAIELPDRFNQYVFCEKDPLQLNALRLRVSRDYSEVKVQFVEGDCNEHIHEILKTIPLHGKQRKVLTFCFADPWNLENLKKNLPLYRLAFFSRHPLGEQFWKEVKKHINPQTSLRFE